MWHSRCVRRRSPTPRGFAPPGAGITMPEKGRTEAPYWVTTQAEARKAVQELAARKVDIVKIWVDDRDGKFKKLTPDLYGAIIDEAHKSDLRVTAHIFNLDDAKGLMKAGLDAFAHSVRDKDIDEEGLAMFKQHPNLVVDPNLPDRGVVTDLSWLSEVLPAEELKKLQDAATDRPEAPKSLRDPGPQSCEDQCGRREDRARNRRQHPVGPSPRDGGHGGRRDDAGSGHHGLDAQCGRVHATHGRGHGGGGEERGLPRARRESAGRHHEYAANRERLPARNRG